MAVVDWMSKSWGQGRAIENARLASTMLSRRRVERDEVELFLREYAEQRESSVSA